MLLVHAVSVILCGCILRKHDPVLGLRFWYRIGKKNLHWNNMLLYLSRVQVSVFFVLAVILVHSFMDHLCHRVEGNLMLGKPMIASVFIMLNSWTDPKSEDAWLGLTGSLATVPTLLFAVCLNVTEFACCYNTVFPLCSFVW